MREYLALVGADIELALRGVHRVVANLRPTVPRPASADELAEMRQRAERVKRAALLYRPGARCLPQAVATARLLRAKGCPVTLVIAVRRFPFAAHAWVECEGRVLTDRQGIRKEFTPSLKSEPSASGIEVPA